MDWVSYWQKSINGLKLPYVRYAPLEVLWIDADGGIDGWQTEDEYEPNNLEIKTVGLYWGETNNSIIIVQSYSLETEGRQIDRALEIPKVCILTIKELNSP